MKNNKNSLGTFGDIDDYNSITLNKHTAKELVKEYRKMRKEARNRLDELSHSEFSDSKLLENKEFLQDNPSYMTKRELRHNLSAVAGFLNSKLSTVEGQKERAERTIETLNDMGYSNINLKNYQQFGKFMDNMRTYIENNIIGSYRLLEIYDTAKEKNISVENVRKNISFYNRNMDAIAELDLNRKRPYTVSDLQKILKRHGTLEE